jgi:hypothetical protein
MKFPFASHLAQNPTQSQAVPKKSPTEYPQGYSVYLRAKKSLDPLHIRRLGAFSAVRDVKAYPIAFGKRLEAISLNLRKVDKNVRTVVLLDKTKPFCVIEPLYCTFSHFFYSSCFFNTLLGVQILPAA